MRDDDDDQVNHLLRSLAPPERDPLFRIRVLERRERRQFVRHVALLVGGGDRRGCLRGRSRHAGNE